MKPPLSNDSKALLMLALPTFSGEDKTPKMTPKKWAEFSLQLVAAGIAPGDLLSVSSDDANGRLGKFAFVAAAVAALPSQGAKLGLWLERLSSEGIWITTIYEPTYPPRLKAALKDRAPLWLYGAGDARLLTQRSIGFVGSRDAQTNQLQQTAALAGICVREGFAIVSGGAKGVDQEAERAAIDAGGEVVSVLAEGLSKPLENKATRNLTSAGKLCLVSPFEPSAHWVAGRAMERNKFIHAMARYSIVISSGNGEGGTWSGATENLRNQWSPLLVCTYEGAPEGNRRLIADGGHALDLEQVVREGKLQPAIRRLASAAEDPSKPTANTNFSPPANQKASQRKDWRF